MRESWLKNDILFLIITFFSSKTDKYVVVFFAFFVVLRSFQRQKGKIESFLEILCVLNNFYLISEKRSIRLKG